MLATSLSIGLCDVQSGDEPVHELPGDDAAPHRRQLCGNLPG